MFESSHERRNAIEQRRLLHARIARSRRRINGHTSRLAQVGLLPGSWRRHIQEHPAMALAAAAGTGMLLAQLCTRTGAARRSADWLARWLAGGSVASLLKHVEQLLATGKPASPPPATEPNDA